MEAVFADNLNKKNDMYQARCACKAYFYVFLDTATTKYYTVCPRCANRVFFVTCENPQCGVGQYIAEDDKEINNTKTAWTCSTCQTSNQVLPCELIKNYRKDEIPPEVMKAEHRGLLPVWLGYVIYISLIIYFVIHFIALFISPTSN
jgi:DNA-directed RNA polymerase subunit RPC12/RpoP